ASHAVGHFNGAAWSVADWEKELRAFGEIVQKVGPNNRLADAKLAFAASDVIGFRAPYLAKGTALYSALKTLGFRCDTSGVGYADAWPEKIDGLWVQRGHAENSRLRQGHVVDGLQFLCGAVARCPRSAPLRNGAGPDAANRPSVLQTQLRRKSSATPYWASFHELWRRRLQRGAKVIRTRG